MCLEPERLDPDVTLVRIPNDPTTDPSNTKKMTQLLRDDANATGYYQMTLFGILHSNHVDINTVLDALAAWFCDTEIRGF